MESNCVQIENVHDYIASFMASMVKEGYYSYLNDVNLCKLSTNFEAFPVMDKTSGEMGLMFFIFADNNTLEVMDFQHAREHWSLEDHFNDWLLKDNASIVTKFIPGNHIFSIRSRLATYLKNYFDIQDSECGPYTLTDEERESLVEIKLADKPEERRKLVEKHSKAFCCEYSCVEALLYRLESKDFIRSVKTEGVMNEYR